MKLFWKKKKTEYKHVVKLFYMQLGCAERAKDRTNAEHGSLVHTIHACVLLFGVYFCASS